MLDSCLAACVADLTSGLLPEVFTRDVPVIGQKKTATSKESRRKPNVKSRIGGKKSKSPQKRDEGEDGASRDVIADAMRSAGIEAVTPTVASADSTEPDTTEECSVANDTQMTSDMSTSQETTVTSSNDTFNDAMLAESMDVTADSTLPIGVLTEVSPSSDVKPTAADVDVTASTSQQSDADGSSAGSPSILTRRSLRTKSGESGAASSKRVSTSSTGDEDRSDSPELDEASPLGTVGMSPMKRAVVRLSDVTQTHAQLAEKGSEEGEGHANAIQQSLASIYGKRESGGSEGDDAK